MINIKTGIIDVGGGLRGVYAAGVFDRCLDMNIHFDVGIGVSAGSANVASYIAGQKKRNYSFYTEYTFRREYMSVRNFLYKKSYIDMDYVYSQLSNSDGENPLDYQGIMNSKTEFIAVAAIAKTGQEKYFDKNDLHNDDYSVLKASCAIPVVCHPYEVEGVPYFDGALGDTVPMKKAVEMGCDKVVLILTKPKDVLRNSRADNMLADIIQKSYPCAAAKLRTCAQQYNDGVALAKEYEKSGQALIIAPDDTCGVNTLTKNKTALKQLYEKGYCDAEKINAFINK